MGAAVAQGFGHALHRDRFRQLRRHKIDGPPHQFLLVRSRPRDKSFRAAGAFAKRGEQQQQMPRRLQRSRRAPRAESLEDGAQAVFRHAACARIRHRPRRRQAGFRHPCFRFFAGESRPAVFPGIFFVRRVPGQLPGPDQKRVSGRQFRYPIPVHEAAFSGDHMVQEKIIDDLRTHPVSRRRLAFSGEQHDQAACGLTRRIGSDAVRRLFANRHGALFLPLSPCSPAHSRFPFSVPPPIPSLFSRSVFPILS